MVGGGRPGRLGTVTEVLLSGGVAGAERAVWAPRALGREVVVGSSLSVGRDLPDVRCIDVSCHGVSWPWLCRAGQTPTFSPCERVCLYLASRQPVEAGCTLTSCSHSSRLWFVGECVCCVVSLILQHFLGSTAPLNHHQPLVPVGIAQKVYIELQ